MATDRTSDDVEFPLLAAYRLVLQDVANWRHEALGDPEEFGKRDRFLLTLETIAKESAHRLTGSYI